MSRLTKEAATTTNKKTVMLSPMLPNTNPTVLAELIRFLAPGTMDSSFSKSPGRFLCTVGSPCVRTNETIYKSEQGQRNGKTPRVTRSPRVRGHSNCLQDPPMAYLFLPDFSSMLAIASEI